MRSPSPSTRVLVASAAATTACVFPPFLLGAMAVQVRSDLGFSEAGTGLGVGAFFFAASLGSAALGRRAERIGAGRALRLAALWSAGTQLLVAALAGSLPSLLVFLGLAGWSNALAQPSANLLIARSMPAARQGLAFAVKQSAIPASTLLAGLAVPAVALTVGWRWAYAASALLSVLAALSVPTADPGPRDAPAGGGAAREGPPAPGRRDGGAPGGATDGGQGGEAATGRAPLRTMLVLSLGIGFGAAAAGSLGAFLVTSGVEAGMRPGPAGLMLTLGSAVGITVRLLAGVLADRRGRGHLRVVARMMALGSAGYALIATGRPGVMVAAVPLAFGAGWAWPGLFNLAVVLANPGSPAAATGITQTGTYFGAVAGPLAFGFLAEHVSFGIAWLAAAAVSLLGAAAIATGRSMLRRDRVALEPLPPLPAT